MNSPLATLIFGFSFKILKSSVFNGISTKKSPNSLVVKRLSFSSLGSISGFFLPFNWIIVFSPLYSTLDFISLFPGASTLIIIVLPSGCL